MMQFRVDVFVVWIVWKYVRGNDAKESQGTEEMSTKETSSRGTK